MENHKEIIHDQKVNIRLNTEELSLIRYMAKRKKQSISGYCSLAALNQAKKDLEEENKENIIIY